MEWLELLLSPAILSVLVTLVVLLLGFAGNVWLNKIRLVFQVWHLAEKMGVLEGLKGYEKLVIAMTEFRKRFFEKYGREPSPNDDGWAVKWLEKLCRLEDKEAVIDFLDESAPDGE